MIRKMQDSAGKLGHGTVDGEIPQEEERAEENGEKRIREENGEKRGE